jgi:hypothetical protein
MWWLNQYSRDSQRPHNLSNRQIKSVNAFRHFEKEGIDFLIEAGRLNKVPVSTSPWDLWSGFTHKLNNIQWIKKFGFFQTYPNRRLAALNLLKQLEFPFEWVQEHVSLPIRSQPYPQLIASITLLQGVTNHQSELINEVAPCLGLMNQNSVLDTLASLYRDQEPQPEVEKH